MIITSLLLCIRLSLRNGEMIDYNLVMYIGLGLIVGGFCLFLYSEMRLRQLDREQWLSDQLTESFNKEKNNEQNRNNKRVKRNLKGLSL